MTKPKRCVCGRKAELSFDDDGFEVSCSRCGKTSGYYENPYAAVEEWNRPKDISDMASEKELNRVIIA